MFARAARRWRRLVEATVAATAATATTTGGTSGQVLVAGQSSVATVAVQLLLPSVIVDESKFLPAVMVVPVPVVVWIPVGDRRRWRRFPDPRAVTPCVDNGIVLVATATAIVVIATSRILLNLVIVPESLIRRLPVSSTPPARPLPLGAQAQRARLGVLLELRRRRLLLQRVRAPTLRVPLMPGRPQMPPPVQTARLRRSWRFAGTACWLGWYSSVRATLPVGTTSNGGVGRRATVRIDGGSGCFTPCGRVDPSKVLVTAGRFV